MLKELTYKKKNILLIAGAVIFAILVYKAAFVNTINAYVKSSELKQKLSTIEDAPRQIASIDKKMKAFDKILGGNRNSKDYQEVILKAVSGLCSRNNIVLKEFPNPYTYQEQGMEVEVNKIVVEGTFSRLLSLVYELEQKQNIAKVASLHFNTYIKNNGEQKITYLTSTIYLQHVKPLK